MYNQFFYYYYSLKVDLMIKKSLEVTSVLSYKPSNLAQTRLIDFLHQGVIENSVAVFFLACGLMVMIDEQHH